MPARSRAVRGHPDVSRRRTLQRVLVLGSLTALGPLTIDFYLPAFPSIATDLGATESSVQFTLTGTLLGFSAGQLILGPLSDALGRRRPLIAATVAHVVASVLCALAPTVAVLAGLRVLQGMAAAAGAVISMAVVRDLYTGLPAIRLLSRLMLVTGVAPVLAPSLGGVVLQHTDWRGIFWLLAALGSALAVVVLFGLKETLPPAGRRTGGLGGTVRTYVSISRDRIFVGLVLTSALMIASLFAYLAGSSFVFQGVYGMSEQMYGALFGINSVGLVIATQVNARLIRHVRPQSVLAGALVIGAVAAGSMVFSAATELFGFAGVAGPLFVLLVCVGFTMPNAPVLALAGHGRSAGTASALLGGTNFAVGAVTAPLVGAFGSGSAVPMAAVMLVATVLAVGALLLVARPARLPPVEAMPSTVAGPVRPVPGDPDGERGGPTVADNAPARRRSARVAGRSATRREPVAHTAGARPAVTRRRGRRARRAAPRHAAPRHARRRR